MPDNSLILIVDDEADFREIFQTQLAAAGYRVETANSGEEGIVKAKAMHPKLILMDVKMPGMDGVAAAIALRQDPALDNTKIVFLTSFGDPRSEVQGIDDAMAKSMGFEGYIKKTVDLGVVVSKVRDFVAGS